MKRTNLKNTPNNLNKKELLELKNDIAGWLKDFENSQPKNLIAIDDDLTFEGSAYVYFQRVLRLLKGLLTPDIHGY